MQESKHLRKPDQLPAETDPIDSQVYFNLRAVDFKIGPAPNGPEPHV